MKKTKTNPKCVNYVTTFAYDVMVGVPAGYFAETTTDAKGNITTKVYDKTKRLYTVTADGKTTTYAYYANGATQKITYHGGFYSEYTYYFNGQLHTLATCKANGNIIDAYNYGYDLNGNMAQKMDGIGTTSYGYDKLDRLISVSEPGGQITTYTYNLSGNRSTETTTYSGASITKAYNYGVRGWLMSTVEVNGTMETTVRYTYDGNGNQTTRMKEITGPASGSPSGSLSNESDYAAYYAYDAWNNMTLSVSGENTVENFYDGSGLRYGRRVDGGDMTVSLYEYADVVLEINATTGAQIAVNVYGNHIISRNGQTLLHNGNGDVTGILSNGAIVATYYYDAFGVHTSVTGNANNPYRYAGYMFDEETGLYYLKSRYYDPETARFLQEDTYLGSAADPLSLNLYAYGKYNPLKYYDPTGYASVNINGNTIQSQKDSDLFYMSALIDAAGGSIYYANDRTTYTLNGNTYSVSGYPSNAVSLSGFNSIFGTSYSDSTTPSGNTANLTADQTKQLEILINSYNGASSVNHTQGMAAIQAEIEKLTGKPFSGNVANYDYNNGGIGNKNTNVIESRTDSTGIASDVNTDVMISYIAEKNNGTWNYYTTGDGRNRQEHVAITMNNITRTYTVGAKDSSLRKINDHWVINNQTLMTDFKLSENQSIHLEKDYFHTRDDAAIAFALMYNPTAIESKGYDPDNEWSANIYMYNTNPNKHNFFFDNVTEGSKYGAYFPELNTDHGFFVAGIHTHGTYKPLSVENNYNFSDRDKETAKKNNTSVYLVTCDGQVKSYSPEYGFWADLRYRLTGNRSYKTETITTNIFK